MLKDFLFWSLLLNLAMLLWWFFIYSFKKDFVLKIHKAWFDLDQKDFDLIHYKAMAYYKIGIFLFFLFPYLSLHIIT